MRKQTKLVAVLSTAALLAVGASMTSFAAQGWAEDNGTWVYYDKSGNMATEQWQKSGDNWFYLDESGEMAIDQLIETNNNWYYVDENGAMVTNQWVAVENDEYDGEEDEPAEWWYYFQANGKAMKGSDNGSVNLKTINGKKYTFDEEGRMLYGWVDENGERQTGDDAWKQGKYYFGSEDDGAMTIGWVLMNIIDGDANDKDDDTAFDDEEQERWFYFKTNGKKMYEEKGKNINGAKYGFDEYGRMIAEWTTFHDKATSDSMRVESIKKSTASTAVAKGEVSRTWRYYGSPESGARYTKGWFKVVPSKGLNDETYEDDEDKWYYSDKDGKLIANELITINGRKYAFDESGSMIDGLRFISVLKNNKNEIVTVHGDGSYDTEEKFNNFANGNPDSFAQDEITPNYNIDDASYDYITYCYYFGNGDDGSMKTGKQTVDINGDDFTFLFDKSGGTKGAGKFGEHDDKYYLNGKLLKADKEDKYSVIKVTKSDNKVTNLELLTTDEFVNGNPVSLGEKKQNINGENFTPDKNNVYYKFPTNSATEEYYLVNTSGKIETKSKSKAKDGNDICYQVKDGKIIAVFEEKN